MDFDRLEDGETIVKEFLARRNRKNQPFEMQKKTIGHILTFIDDNASTSKKWSVKNIERLKRQVFSFNVDQNYHGFAQVVNISTKWLSAPQTEKNIPIMRFLAVEWVSTPRGRIYRVNLHQCPVSILVVSHVFDRMAQRAFSNELGRIKAIGEFFWTSLIKGGYMHTSPNYETHFFTEKGLALGSGFSLNFSNKTQTPMLPTAFFQDPKITTDQFHFLVLKTFVTDLRPYQIALKNKLIADHSSVWKADHSMRLATYKEAKAEEAHVNKISIHH